VGALPHRDSPRPAGETELERVRIAAATGRLRFQLAVAAPMARFTPVAELHVGAPLPIAADALRFLPLNAGGGLEPLGILNEMRRYAYPMSQWAWGRTRRDGARTQREAKRISDARVLSFSHHSLRIRDLDARPPGEPATRPAARESGVDRSPRRCACGLARRVTGVPC